MADEDRAKGSGKKIEGQLEEKAGQALGDKKAEREGRRKQTEGEAQNTWGSVKDTVRDKT